MSLLAASFVPCVGNMHVHGLELSLIAPCVVNMHVLDLELSLIVVCRLYPSSRASFTIFGRVAVSSCHAGMIVTDPELGVDGIGVPPPSLAKHADVNTMTTRSRMAWIGTTWAT